MRGWGPTRWKGGVSWGARVESHRTRGWVSCRLMRCKGGVLCEEGVPWGEKVDVQSDVRVGSRGAGRTRGV